MTSYQEKHIQDETNEEYEGLHTNYFGNQHEDEATLENAMHEFLIRESEREL